MLGEKGEIHSSEHNNKVCLGYTIVESDSCENMIPESHAGKDREYSTYWENVVEVGYYVIGIMQRNV